MYPRATLHRLVDFLSEEDLTTAGRLLIGLTMTADAVERALLLAPMDDTGGVVDAAAVIVTVPLPDPLAPLVMVNHGALLVAVQGG